MCAFSFFFCYLWCRRPAMIQFQTQKRESKKAASTWYNKIIITWHASLDTLKNRILIIPLSRGWGPKKRELWVREGRGLSIQCLTIQNRMIVGYSCFFLFYFSFFILSHDLNSGVGYRNNIKELIQKKKKWLVRWFWFD